MHYKDGTEARLGDVVKGAGYNVPGVIVGTVVHLTPAADACNIQVAYVATAELPGGFTNPDHHLFHQTCVIGEACPEAGRDCRVGAYVDREYGQCDAFELIHRPA